MSISRRRVLSSAAAAAGAGVLISSSVPRVARYLTKRQHLRVGIWSPQFQDATLQGHLKKLGQFISEATAGEWSLSFHADNQQTSQEFIQRFGSGHWDIALSTPRFRQPYRLYYGTFHSLPFGLSNESFAKWLQLPAVAAHYQAICDQQNLVSYFVGVRPAEGGHLVSSHFTDLPTRTVTSYASLGPWYKILAFKPTTQTTAPIGRVVPHSHNLQKLTEQHVSYVSIPGFYSGEMYELMVPKSLHNQWPEDVRNLLHVWLRDNHLHLTNQFLAHEKIAINSIKQRGLKIISLNAPREAREFTRRYLDMAGSFHQVNRTIVDSYLANLDLT